MKEEDLKNLISQGIKEAYFQGLQSGKKETSDLVAGIKQEIKILNEGQLKIQEHLKIQDEHIEASDVTMTDHFEKVDTHMTLIEEYIPLLKGLDNLQSGGMIIGKLIVFIAAVGGAWLIIKSWWMK